MNSVKLTKARLIPQTGDPIEVQFNGRWSTTSRTACAAGRDATRRQLVTQATHDCRWSAVRSTSTASVRERTLPIKRLLRPDEAKHERGARRRAAGRALRVGRSWSRD
jgi:hypothetical protein